MYNKTKCENKQKSIKINEKSMKNAMVVAKNVIQTKRKSKDIDKTIDVFCKIFFSIHKAIYFEGRI